jgi:hypothetical protein
VPEYKVEHADKDSCFLRASKKDLTAALSRSRLYIAIDLIESYVLFLNISATNLRAATPFRSATRTTLRYLTPV